MLSATLLRSSSRRNAHCLVCKSFYYFSHFFCKLLKLRNSRSHRYDFFCRFFFLLASTDRVFRWLSRARGEGGREIRTFQGKKKQRFENRNQEMNLKKIGQTGNCGLQKKIMGKFNTSQSHTHTHYHAFEVDIGIMSGNHASVKGREINSEGTQRRNCVSDRLVARTTFTHKKMKMVTEDISSQFSIILCSLMMTVEKSE